MGSMHISPQLLMRLERLGSVTGKLLLLALAYYVSARFGLAIPYKSAYITLVWLPTGIALAGLLRWGLRYWPAVYAGVFVAEISVGFPWYVCASLGVTSTLGPLLAAWLLQRVQFSATFEHQRDTWLFVGFAALGMLVTSAGGVGNLYLYGNMPAEAVAHSWLTWWMGDWTGVLLAGPLLITITRNEFNKLWAMRREFLLWCALVTIISWLFLFHNISADEIVSPFKFLTLPIMIWATLRFGVVGGSLAALSLSIIAASGYVLNSGSGGNIDSELLLLWYYMVVLTLINLIVTAFLAQRRLAEVKLQRLNDRLARRSTILDLINRNHALNEILHKLIELVETSNPAMICSILLMDKDGQHLRHAAAPSLPDFYNQAIDGLKIGEGVGCCGTAMARRERVIVEDITTHPYWVSFLDLAVRANLRSCWSQPVLNHAGEVLGSFAVYHHTVSRPNDEEIALIEDCAQLATLAIEHERAEEELRIAATAFELQEGLMITDAKRVILRVNAAFVEMIGYSSQELVGNTAALFDSGRHDEKFFQKMREALKTHKYWRGEIWNKHKNGVIFPCWMTISVVPDRKGKAASYVASVVNISKDKETEAEIYQLAFYDVLTGLPNRRILHDRLQQAMATSTRYKNHGAVLFVDLDNFKTLNDTHGHDIGDLMLIEVARRLQACVREGDTVVRLGGDEFVVMLDGLSEQASQAATQVDLVAEKMLQAVSRPYFLREQGHHITPSIGITLFQGREQSVDELLKRADTAMYQAKASGRNSLRFFDPAMQKALEERILLESELRMTLQKNTFVLHYQVQVNEHLKIIGAEALLRWQHPRRGLLEPSHFIALLEETGLIVPIGHWVLESACKQLKAWEKNPASCDLQLAVNVSVRQFRIKNFVNEVHKVLNDTGANPARLKFELTESLVIDDVVDTVGKMQALKKLGISFTIDDFGTGYSSLAYLKRLPLDQLKIDKSFVRDIIVNKNDAVIVQTIIGMAISLGMDTLAEGVETVEQQNFLSLAGCRAYQGYLYGYPVPLADFEQQISRQVISVSS